MRGKLRDKRASEKHNHVKREVIEKRRPAKHDWTSWSEPEEDDFDLENDEANTDDEAEKKVVEISPNGTKSQHISKV
jgi:hypothetical protein